MCTRVVNTKLFAGYGYSLYLLEWLGGRGYATSKKSHFIDLRCFPSLLHTNLSLFSVSVVKIYNYATISVCDVVVSIEAPVKFS